MRVTVAYESNYVVDALMGAMRPESRAELFPVAARAVMNFVQRHIRGYMRTKHHTANALGARPTGHYEEGARDMSYASDSSGAEVRIPIPGIDRAYKDVQIRPGPGKRALTLPRAAIAYGRKVEEVEKDGWVVFHPTGTNWLLGRRAGEDTSVHPSPTLLYTLVGGVVQRRDPSLLPSQGDIAATGWQAMWKRIQADIAKARAGGLKK